MFRNTAALIVAHSSPDHLHSGGYLDCNFLSLNYPQLVKLRIKYFKLNSIEMFNSKFGELLECRDFARFGSRGLQFFFICFNLLELMLRMSLFTSAFENDLEGFLNCFD